MECSKSTDPEEGTDPRCGVSESNIFTWLPSQSPPDVNYVEGNTRVCGYSLLTMGICPYVHVFVSIYVEVDTSAVTEGMTVKGKVNWGLFEANFTTSVTHNVHNTGTDAYEGSTDVGLMVFAPDSAYCAVYALIKFPTKGSAAADLNYLYTKVIEGHIWVDYYHWKPQTVY